MIVYYQSNLFYYVALIVSASGEASGQEEALPSPEKKVATSRDSGDSEGVVLGI